MKYAIFAFMGEKMCFQHVLLNAIDMDAKGYDVKIIIEGQAVKLIQVMEEDGNKLFARVKDAGLIDSVCKACSQALGVLEYNAQSGIRLGDDMNGHPSIASYVAGGYKIITM